MLTTEQVKNITYLYGKFVESENKGWSTIDDFLEVLQWLDDDQLYRECDVLYSYHKNMNMGCPYPHKPDTICFVPKVLDAVEAIIELYSDTSNMHPRNRYILEYYLALCQDQQIISLEP